MRKYIVFVASLASVLAVNIYFRSFPVYFPQLKEQAKKTVGQEINRQAVEEIDKNFPGFDALAKSRLKTAWVANYKKQNSREIKKQTEQEYLKLKDRFQDDQGQTYLLELDPWTWARYTENVLRLGHPGDKVVNGRQVDSFLVAPFEGSILWNHFLYYFSGFLYKAFSIFKLVPLFTFLFYLPLVFTTIFITLLYLFCFFRWGNIASIVACLFAGLAPVFIFRSSAGWFDTDILNLLFPLLALWMYLKAYGAANLKSRTLWVLISGFWVGLFSFTWVGWWFIFMVILLYEAYTLINLADIYYRYKQEISVSFKLHIICLGLFLLFSCFWVLVISGAQPLQSLFIQLKSYLTLNNLFLAASIWPNTYSTVSEFKRVDFTYLIDVLGGAVIFVVAVASLITFYLATRRNLKYSDFEREESPLLIIWFSVMLFACLQGTKFIIFLFIPLGVSLGWLANELFGAIKKLKRKLPYGAFIFIIGIFCFKCIANGYNAAKRVFPMMHDEYYKALVKIRETTPGDAIINSWWDYGDWFKPIARRRIIFDGQSQNTPFAYWMARALLENDEEEAASILRMMDNSGNRAFEVINKNLKDPIKSVMLLEKAISLEPKAAEAKLSEFLRPEAKEAAAKLLFARPDEAFFVVDPNLQNILSNISILGNWNFSKAYLANLRQKEKTQALDYLMKLGLNKQEIERLSQELSLIPKAELENWISYRLKFYSGELTGQEKNGIVLFEGGTVYDPRSEAIYVYTFSEGKYGYKVPKSLFVFKENRLEEVVYPDNEVDFSVLVSKLKDEYKAVLLDRQLANSLFVRLYFLEGRGLKHFKPFIEEKDASGYIRVFKINWE